MTKPQTDGDFLRYLATSVDYTHKNYGATVTNKRMKRLLLIAARLDKWDKIEQIGKTHGGSAQ